MKSSGNNIQHHKGVIMADCYNKIILKEKNIEVPCGKCLNCLNNKKKEKALRFIQEMNNYKFKLFIFYSIK